MADRSAQGSAIVPVCPLSTGHAAVDGVEFYPLGVGSWDAGWSRLLRSRWSMSGAAAGTGGPPGIVRVVPRC